MFAHPGHFRLELVELGAELIEPVDGIDGVTHDDTQILALRLGHADAPPDSQYAGKTLGQVEREMLERAMRQADGNKAQAARLLGIPRSSLYDLIKRHGLE